MTKIETYYRNVKNPIGRIMKKAAQRINTIFLLADVIEQAAFETEHLLKKKNLFKFEIKQKINALKSAAGWIVKFADSKQAAAYGDKADDLKQVIYKYLIVK